MFYKFFYTLTKYKIESILHKSTNQLFKNNPQIDNQQSFDSRFFKMAYRTYTNSVQNNSRNRRYLWSLNDADYYLWLLNNAKGRYL